MNNDLPDGASHMTREEQEALLAQYEQLIERCNHTIRELEHGLFNSERDVETSSDDLEDQMVAIRIVYAELVEISSRYEDLRSILNNIHPDEQHAKT